MLTLSEADIAARIRRQEPFEAILEGGSLVLTIDKYLPSICVATHSGNRLRKDLESVCALSPQQRLYEEDHSVDALTSSFPITLVAQDSRFEYDLNKPLAHSVYQRLRDKSVWTKKLSETQIDKSLEKHRQFYRILDVLVDQLEKRFNACILFDIHSYSYQHIDRETPTFNLGTDQIDMDRWGLSVDYFQKELRKISLPNLSVTTARNDVCSGRGYLIAHINSRFKYTLALPTEVKKIYLDETSGELFPLVLDDLKEGMKHAISETAAYFSRKHTRKSRMSRHEMFSASLDPAILDIDKQLYQLAKKVVVLQHVNPTNLAQELKCFFAKKGKYTPAFSYQQLKIDPYQFKEQLYRLPTDDIRDAGIQQLYRQTINDFAAKIDLLVSIGSDKFIYNSLRYYGEPSEQDLANARFLLYAPDFEENEEDENISAVQMVMRFREAAKREGLNCKVELSSRLVAAAMVDNGHKTILINRQSKVSDTELQALIHHELGVHMVTSLNAVTQPLKIFSLGLPGNTLAQEGLAILAEYISGNITMTRLKRLALRVVAVDTMIRHGDFTKTYQVLHEDHNLGQNKAFQLAARVHRGGGFTKDYLYLRGLSEALKLYREEKISNLFIGKTGFESLPLINELIARGALQPPVHLPMFLSQKKNPSAVLEYLMNSIR